MEKAETITTDRQLSNDKEQVKRKSILLISCQIINGFVTVLTGMIVPRCLPIEEYAFYKQALLVFNVVYPFLTLGLTQGLYFFLPIREERKKNLIVDTYIIYILVGIMYIVFLRLGGAKLFSEYIGSRVLKVILYWQVPYITFSLIDQCVGIVFNIENKVKRYIIYNVVNNVITSVVLVFILTWRPYAVSAVIVLSLCKLFGGSFGIGMVMRVMPKEKVHISFRDIKELLLFSLPVGISGMVGALAIQIDQIFISALFDEKTYAIYSIGATDFPFYSFIISSIATAMFPMLRKYMDRKEFGLAIQVEREVAVKVSSFTIPLMFFLFFWSEEYISFMYTVKYIESTTVFKIYLMQYPLYVFLESPLFISMGLSKQLLWKTVFSCFINVLLNIICIWHWGMYGAAIGTIISDYVICFFYTMPLLAKKMGRTRLEIYPYRKMAMHVLWGAIAGKISCCIKWIMPASNYDFAECIKLLMCGGLVYLGVYIVYSRTCMKEEYAWVYNSIGKYGEKFYSIFKR